jgi:capsular exopolysaccharide synthesis family protein
MQAGQNLQNLPMNGHTRLEDPSLTTSDAGDLGEGKRKGGLKLRPLVATVRRNIPLIAGITVAATGIGYLLYRSSPLIFQGNFSLLVEPISSQSRSTDPYAISRAQSNDTTGSSVDYPTLLQVLQSPELLSKIAVQIQAGGYNKVTAASLARDLKNKDLTVERVGTNLIDSTRTLNVAYQGTDPKQVQFVLDKLAEGYLRFSLEDRKTRIGGGVEFIEDQLPALQQRVNALEAQVQSIRQRYRFTDPSIENQQVADQLKEVRQKKLDAETLLREQATLYATLQRQLGLTPEQALAAAALSQNPRYQDLLNQLKKVESQISISLARYNEDSPVVQRLREQQRNLTRLLGQETQKNLTETSPGVPETSRVVAYQDPTRLGLIQQLVQSANQTRALQARTNEIIRTENNLDQRLTQLPAIIRQYNALTQQLDIATKTLNQFLLQRETLRVEAAQKEVPWEIISKPKLVSDPVTGKIVASRGKKAQQLLFMSVGLGLALGVAAAFLREKLRNVFVTAEDLQDAIQLPFLGSVPLRAGMGRDPLGSSRGSDPFSEAFSALYTNLRFLNPGSDVHSVAIVSAEPGDGKTTIALNLAQAAASMGQRVLLVDANLCAPQIHTLLDLPNQKGLADILSQKLPVEAAIQNSPSSENLSVLTAGSIQMESTKLFASNEMQQLMKNLRGMFDLIIYDTPALRGLTDTNFLTAQTDGILMVGGVNKTKRSVFMQELEGLNKYRIPVIGVIANHLGKGHVTSYLLNQQPSQGQQVHPAFFGNLKQSGDVVQ